MARPFNFQYDLGELGTHTIEYVSQEARIAAAEERAAAELAAQEEAAEAAARAAANEAAKQISPDETDPATPDVAAAGTEVGAEPGEGAGGIASSATDSLGAESGDSAATTEGELGGSELVAIDGQDLDLVVAEDESFLQRTFAGTSWGRVALMLVVVTLGLAAFFTKSPPLRWVALSATLFGLGFADGGFLSVSHITSGIWAGVGIYLRDLPLLILVLVTVVTTLIWGRVFCGFLCPFGALQDFIEKVVPRSWQKPLPAVVHDRAVWVKYGLLAVVVLPAIAGSRTSLYQYVEPFGTVFFQSPSILLWAIALLFLGASIVVPRFYCRYACPLGASLGLLSLVSLRRIERVEQCNHCKVCEQRCPTGAIRGPEIDFKECVRCNECEVLLIEKAGVCQHDMAEIRPRLVQLKASRSTVDA
jgi:ferredoxin